MNNKIDWINLIGSYCLFGFIYSAVIWAIWSFLFAPFFNITFTYLQVLGAYTIARLFFGNTNTNYVSNFYSPKVPNLDKIDQYLKDLQDELDEEGKKIEQEYENIDKRKNDKE